MFFCVYMCVSVGLTAISFLTILCLYQESFLMYFSCIFSLSHYSSSSIILNLQVRADFYHCSCKRESKPESQEQNMCEKGKLYFLSQPLWTKTTHVPYSARDSLTIFNQSFQSFGLLVHAWPLHFAKSEYNIFFEYMP